MFGLGTFEIIIILVIVLVIFGAGKLPKVMGDLGKGVKSFKTAMDEKETDVAQAVSEEAKTIEGDAKREADDVKPTDKAV
ncbi:MAG: twin-arginine translocase TatA/TatE family subunit [Magnetococcales bacterium]|nr:twin-arginine translocase TatA/TatE family subunit [Magnetococcales bacterium]